MHNSRQLIISCTTAFDQLAERSKSDFQSWTKAYYHSWQKPEAASTPRKTIATSNGPPCAQLTNHRKWLSENRRKWLPFRRRSQLSSSRTLNSRMSWRGEVHRYNPVRDLCYLNSDNKNRRILRLPSAHSIGMPQAILCCQGLAFNLEPSDFSQGPR